MTAEGDDWARQRERAIAAHGAELARREADEARRAGAMLAEFVAQLRARGIAPVPLHARSYGGGRGRFRTRLRGWYLNPDRSIAVDEAGEFYILTVPSTLRGRLSGVDVPPARPRLVIGEGGRDGERITLRALLDQRLAALS
jgi:hypothetical protein